MVVFCFCFVMWNVVVDVGIVVSVGVVIVVVVWMVVSPMTYRAHL